MATSSPSIYRDLHVLINEVTSHVQNKNKHKSSRYNESERLSPFTCGKSKRPRRTYPIYREYEGRTHQIREECSLAKDFNPLCFMRTEMQETAIKMNRHFLFVAGIKNFFN